MKYHLEPVQWIFRGYETGSWENKDPFDLVMNVVKTGEDEVYIFAAHGKISKDIREQLRRILFPYGITKCKFVRHKKLQGELKSHT